MDNNCASVTFPDFTRGEWNKVKGYKHAYATAEEEAAVEAYSAKVTEAQKAAAAKYNLWKLYDDVKAAKDATAKAKAQKAYNAAAAKAKAQVAKAEKALNKKK